LIFYVFSVTITLQLQLVLTAITLVCFLSVDRRVGCLHAATVVSNRTVVW